MSPKRSHDRRSRVDVLSAQLDRVARPCIATVVPADPADPGGVIGMLMMACPPGSACPICTDARARLRPWPTPPPAAVAPAARDHDTDDLLEDE